MTGIAKIDINAQVGINEVVAIYVSKYETNLSDKKKLIADAIRSTKHEIEELIEMIRGSINVSKYANVDLSVLGLTAEGEVDLFWTTDYRGKQYTYRISVNVKGDQHRHINLFQRDFPMNTQHVAAYESLTAKLKEQEFELQQVIMDLKAVNQKERQVRARLAEMKLQEAGVELHSHPELLKLVEMK